MLDIFVRWEQARQPQLLPWGRHTGLWGRCCHHTPSSLSHCGKPASFPHADGLSPGRQTLGWGHGWLSVFINHLIKKNHQEQRLEDAVIKMKKAAGVRTSNRIIVHQSDGMSFELGCPIITIHVPGLFRSRRHSNERHAQAGADTDLVPDHSTGDRTEIEYLSPLYWTPSFSKGNALSLFFFFFQTLINRTGGSEHVLGIINVATH